MFLPGNNVKLILLGKQISNNKRRYAMPRQRTSTSTETEYEAQVLRSGGKTLLEQTIDFIGDNVSIEDVYTEEQIIRYVKGYLSIERVYDLDDIADYAKANGIGGDHE